jgi:anthranilate synthase/aminodeoxychorismate synthase-like glutamine amidotransferase
MSRDVILIDNLDSFTFNLVEAFERLGSRVAVLRNSARAADVLDRALKNDALIVLSPGPGRPEDAGCCLELISLAAGQVPLLGICLGHQAIVLEAGGQVIRAPAPVHGKANQLSHDGRGPFAGIDRPIHVGRYHSLCTPNPPARFRVHSEIDRMAMAISDKEAMQVGLQFHPESILTTGGDQILANILRQSWRASAVSFRPCPPGSASAGPALLPSGPASG